MIDRITVGAASLMGALIAGTGLVRWAVAPPARRGQHRAQPRLVTLDELLGEPSAYTSYTTLTDVPQLGPFRQGFGWCDPCAQTTAGIITRDGFTCGEFHRHPAGGGR